MLDATIAHAYQSTERRRYYAQSVFPGETHGWVIPIFKFTSPYLQGVRPPELQFRQQKCTSDETTEESCPFHLSLENELGFACPCYLGNIDLPTILGHIGRDLGYEPIKPHTRGFAEGFAKRAWWNPKYESSWGTLNYEGLLRRTFSWFELYGWLNFCKDAPKRSGNESGFYKKLRPGMERTDDLVAYNFGDVVGLALLFRFLSSTDDRIL